jgi:general stress protein CsbA
LVALHTVGADVADVTESAVGYITGRAIGDCAVASAGLYARSGVWRYAVISVALGAVLGVSGFASNTEGYIASFILSHVELFSEVVGIVYLVECVGFDCLGETFFTVPCNLVSHFTDFTSSRGEVKLAVEDGVVEGLDSLKSHQKGKKGE